MRFGKISNGLWSRNYLDKMMLMFGTFKQSLKLIQVKYYEKVIFQKPARNKIK